MSRFGIFCLVAVLVPSTSVAQTPIKPIDSTPLRLSRLTGQPHPESVDRNTVPAPDTVPAPASGEGNSKSAATESSTTGDEQDAEGFTFKVYGEYGGIGKNGGKPIDRVDRRFQKHDEDYDKYGRFSGEADVRLIESLPRAITSGHVKPLGVVAGAGAMVFFASSPSVYKGVPGTGASNFILYKAEQLRDLTPQQLVRERDRLKQQSSSLKKKLGL